MEKKVVKLKEEEKKLKQDIKEEVKKIKTKPEGKVIKFNDVISGVGVKKSFFFKKFLPIIKDDNRTTFHDCLDKEIANLPNVSGNHMKKVISTFKILIESDFVLSKKAYKDRDERYKNFQIINYACEEIAKYWAIRSATGDKIAYDKVVVWKKDSELIKNVWTHINSRAPKKSKEKFIVLFKSTIKNTLKRIK